jgi:hypothetical protein
MKKFSTGVSDHGSDQGVVRTSPILSVAVLWRRVTGIFRRAWYGTHNAGVAGSSPAPATSQDVVARVFARALAVVHETSATMGATKRSEISGPPSVYDARHGLMPLAFYCSRWAL